MVAGRSSTISLAVLGSRDAARACAQCGRELDPPSLAARAAPDALAFCCAGCRAAYDLVRACHAPAARAPAPASSYAELDESTFRAASVRRLADATLQAELGISGVHCSSCVGVIERAPRAILGLVEARVNLTESVVTLRWREGPGGTTLSAIAREMAAMGYPTHRARDASVRERRRREDRRQLVRIAVAGACAGNVMLLAICLYAGLFEGIDPSHATFFRWTSLAITLVSLAWPGSAFFRSAWTALRTRTPHLDVPITLALVAGAVWSVVSTIRGTGEVYFDSLSVLVFALLAGRFIQSRQQRRAADQVERLFTMTPGSARRIIATSQGEAEEDVPLESIREGDLVLVRAGECIPVDGVVTRGESAVDQAILTGESRPVSVVPGASVAAGSLNATGVLRVRVTAAGERTRIAKLMRLVERGARERAPIVQMADRLAGLFTFGMLGLAALVLVAWLVFEPSRAVEQAVALLVVTCPCALGLATPLTMSVALGRAASSGMLVKTGESVEKLALAPRGSTMLLDKTGTLTAGNLSLLWWQGDEGTAALAGALERHSNHPIAVALARDLGARAGPLGAGDAREIVQRTGAGIEGLVGGRRVAVGSPAFIASIASDPARLLDRAPELAGRAWTPVGVAVDGVVAGLAALGDAVRPDAREAIDALKARGWCVRILSGDHPSVVRAVAASLGIDQADALGGLSPEEKLAIVKDGASKGTVVFVGDGVNDAAALASSTVGVSVRGGAEASLSAADAYLHSGRLASLVELVDGASRTMRVIRRNLVLSFVYNVLAVSGSFGGLVTPLLAALIMPLSSITVLTVALRSRSFDATPRQSESSPRGALP